MLFALGIEEVGEVTGRNLAQRFRDIDALLAATPEQIAQTPGIGEKMADSIRAQLDDERMRSLIADLRAIGLRLHEEGPPPSQGPLADKTLVLTGTLPQLVARAGHRADPRGRRARDRRRCRRRPTTWSPARAPAPSSRRPSGWGWRCSTKRACWRCLTGVCSMRGG